MSRIPIRLRLTIAFTAALALVLLATSLFLYLRLASSLDETIEDTLVLRSEELSRLAGRGTLRLSPAGGISDDEDRFVQLLDADGAVVDGTPRVGYLPVLQREDVARALVAPRTVERSSVEGVDGPVRILAMRVRTPTVTQVLVVGASLADRDEALHGLLVELALVEPAALLLAALLAFGLATAALRPVEAMRAEAAVISAAEPGRRLSLPRATDEISRLGETLNAMLGRLEHALERERGFVAEASHELRTPLALLKAELELASNRPRQQAELEEVLRSAAAETDRLAQLADDLLLSSRAEGGRLPLLRAPVAVADVLARVARRYKRRAEQSGRAVVVEVPTGLTVSADALRLEQALGNLVENAFRHGRGTVRLVALQHGDRIELSVEDEGDGFPSAFLPRAFERFGRAEEARAGPGAGLGLSIVRMIAEAHGGTAQAANGPQGGAVVRLSLPSG